MDARTHDNFPSFTILIKALYVGMGEDPVGNPRTNGFSGVGVNSLILHRKAVISSCTTGRNERMFQKKTFWKCSWQCSCLQQLDLLE